VDNDTIKTENKLGFVNLTVIILTVYVLGALVVDTFWVLPTEISRVLTFFDYIICVFFFIEFLYRFIKSENKLDFMKLGWIDLLSSIPMVDFLRAGRLLRLIRLLRVIRAFRSTRQLLNYIFANKAKGTMTSVSILAFLLIIFSAIAILEVEDDLNSNIKTAEDAIWWTYTTITTVGYGDKYPVTLEGRLIAMALMTFGVGLFGTFTAYIASFFVRGNDTQNKIEN
jgi:voltage-gated potassium channel